MRMASVIAIGTLIDRKLITTAGRKAVVGRPMLYKTTKDFLLRFGLRDVDDLPSIQEFEKLTAGDVQEELFASRDIAVADATGGPDADGGIDQAAENPAETDASSDPEHDQAAGHVRSESSGD